jgi:oxygen-independent coproporphyrinogen-3 oxidase
LTTAPAPAHGLGLYVHWPYCTRICPYCDFNVVRRRGPGAGEADLVEAILADLEGQAALTGPRELTSVFFGGGTPSLMAPADVRRILARAAALWRPAGDLEVSLEANPLDATAERFAALREAGVERLSLGVQSFDDADLARLGRDHDGRQARAAVELALRAFPRVSLDLICAVPGQSEARWREHLSSAVALGVEHVSAYELTIEPGTALARAVARGQVVVLPEPVRAAMFEATSEVLGAAGFEAYEVSNHARGEAARSRHNLLYWRGGDYVGVGPGAHGRLTLQGRRHALESPRRLADYIGAAHAEGGAAAAEPLTARDVALERLLMGLRTLEGVELASLSPLAIPAPRLAGIAQFVVQRDGRLIATPAGRSVLDAVVASLAE